MASNWHMAGISSVSPSSFIRVQIPPCCAYVFACAFPAPSSVRDLCGRRDSFCLFLRYQLRGLDDIYAAIICLAYPDLALEIAIASAISHAVIMPPPLALNHFDLLAKVTMAEITFADTTSLICESFCLCPSNSLKYILHRYQTALSPRPYGPSEDRRYRRTGSPLPPGAPPGSGSGSFAA